MRSLTGESDEINPMMQPFKKEQQHRFAHQRKQDAEHRHARHHHRTDKPRLSQLIIDIPHDRDQHHAEQARSRHNEGHLRFRFADARQIHRQHRGKHAQAPVKEEIGQGIRRVTATKRSLAFFHLNPTAFPKFRAHAAHNVQPFPSRLIYVHHTKSPVAFQAFCARKNFYFCKAVKRYPGRKNEAEYGAAL